MTYALLIDDDASLRMSLERVAGLSELELLTASTWDEGLAMFQVHVPTLVIADYNLPGSQHGLQLLAQIRQLSPSVRLLLVSGYIDEADAGGIEALDLVDRAIPKSSPNAVEHLLQEITDARDRAAVATDWAEYAKARKSARSIEQSEIDALDAQLRKTRGIS